MAQTKIAVEEVERFFQSSEKKIFWFSDLKAIFARYRHAWNLPKAMTSVTFVDWLLSKTKLVRVKLSSAEYPEIVRYGWGDGLSPVLIALSTKRKSYLSHASALWVHGIGGSPRELFVNHEQGEKPANDGTLTQEAIHLAFRNQPRHSKLIYRMSGNTITIVNGKHTGRLGVEQAVSPNGDPVDVTSLERTLIDVTVRPNYAGGVVQVIKAFTSVQGRVSVRKLARLLKTLDYTYPYHQAIGFYLMRSGYTSRDQRLFSVMGINLDFYLCHGLSNPIRDSGWRIFYPRSLG